MKKILFLVALMCAVLNVSAQEDSKWSVKFGAGLSSWVGSDADNVDNAFSYKAGVGYELGISDNFVIEPAIMFSNKSLKIGGVDGTINRYFIEVPVLAAYKIALNDDIKLIINAGPYAAYGIFGSDIDWNGGGTTNVFDEGECDRFEAGIQAGVKVAFNVFEIGAEYARAFTKATSDYDQYTQGFGLTFGYKF